MRMMSIDRAFLRQRILGGERRLIGSLEIEVLVEDTENPEKPMLWTEHGLSILITAEVDDREVRILFDTGASGGPLVHNASLMEVDLRKVDIMVLSHGHYDHTGGLVAALKEIRSKTPIPIILHPDALGRKFALKPRLRYTGIPCSEREVEDLGGRFLASRKPVKLADGITATGEIERVTGFEKTPEDYIILRNGELVRDIMLDDQALIMESRKGLIIITGCAHAGIINTVKHAQKIIKEEKVYALIGGFHLINASDERLTKTIEELKEISPAVIAPCHCTGEKATNKLRMNFKDEFKEVHVGSVLKM